MSLINLKEDIRASDQVINQATMAEEVFATRWDHITDDFVFNLINLNTIISLYL